MWVQFLLAACSSRKRAKLYLLLAKFASSHHENPIQQLKPRLHLAKNERKLFFYEKLETFVNQRLI
jgi:hypothetical protein